MLRERATIARWRFLAVIREIDEPNSSGRSACRLAAGSDDGSGVAHRLHSSRARNDHEQQQQMQQQRGAERPSEDRIALCTPLP
jgi:hypothetical protein